ncbi:hypothetical protein D3C85_1439660 [compost metagenome]
MHFIKAREIGNKRFTQCVIQCIDRTITFSCRIYAGASDVDFDEGFRYNGSACRFLYEHLEGLEYEQFRQFTVGLS